MAGQDDAEYWQEAGIAQNQRRAEFTDDPPSRPTTPPGLATTTRMAARPSSCPAAESPLHPSISRATTSIALAVRSLPVMLALRNAERGTLKDHCRKEW
jgi:hypothetical protein